MAERLLQALLSGLALGSLYALVAQGYYITYTTTNIVNFAQGEFVMVGALMALSFYLGTRLFPSQIFGMNLRTVVEGGLPILLVVVIVVLVLALMGVALERLAIRPLKTFHAVGWIMSTVGVSVMLRGVAQLIWGPDPQRFVSPVRALTDALGLEPVLRPTARTGVTWHEVAVFVLAILVMVGLVLFLRRTLLGKAMVAVAFNKQSAALMGINVRQLVVLAYALSAAIAGLGGIMVAPIIDPSPQMGLVIGLKAFAAAIIGGLTNPFGILIGGLLMGVTEQLVSNLVPGGASWRDASIFVLIILLLAVRPTGLFGQQVVQKF
ncbi:MAG: branched-chain amino acid ABC transporter permease [Chloroflexales bacterium]|nr:branched-chain amino acid ABC transporter permease [Chloroflexales bacterium]